MKFFIDDANVEKIRRIYEYYPVDGVSTNPSILIGNGRGNGRRGTQDRGSAGKEHTGKDPLRP